jgi:outer membrane immunogenic protein
MGDISLKTLKLALLGATFLIGAAGVASAADIYNKPVSYKDGPSDYQPGISWSGFYFGVNAGALFDVVENEDSDDSEAVGLGGIHVGYNWQKHGPWVFGLEGDVNFDSEEDYTASVRARLGYAMGPTLVYATGGVAFLGIEDADEDTVTGFVVGGGIEHKLRENVSVGLEGLYYNFDGEDLGAGFEDNIEAFTVRARLTYHLGGNGHGEALK